MTEVAFEALCRAARAAPHNAALQAKVARALLAEDRAAEAVEFVERAAIAAPQSQSLAHLRQSIMDAVMAGPPDLVRLQLMSVTQADDAAVHLDLGAAYHHRHRPKDAERHFQRALALGRIREARAELAVLYHEAGFVDRAEAEARAAVAAPAEQGDDGVAAAMAWNVLASLAEARGDLAERDRCLDAAFSERNLFRQGAQNTTPTLLVLTTRSAGNVPYADLLPSKHYGRWVWFLEYASPAQFDALPHFDVALNAIGDPDHGAATRDLAQVFQAWSPRPLLNAPQRVAVTARDRLAETLADLTGVVVPKTGKIFWNPAGREAVAKAIFASGDVLLRPLGRHGGQGLRRFGPTDLPKPADFEEGEALYLCPFVESRSEDGFYRKYRAIFVDRIAHPYHLAIGAHWMVHHQTTDMAGDAFRQAEEMAFLRDPQAAIGQGAWAAVESIARRLDLDYGGVDFALTASGEVLVFEANAAMLTHLEPEDSPFVAKNPYVQAIITAFQDLVARRAQPGASN